MDNSKAADNWASSITASVWASTIDEAQNANSNRFVAQATESETEGDTNKGHDEEGSPQFGSGNKVSQAEDSKQTKAGAKAEEAATAEAENMGEAEESAEAGAHRNANLECSTCGEHFPIDDYPVTEGCEHKFETCRQCLEAWIDSQLDNTIVDEGIRCPSTCDRKLSYAELKGQISSDLYSKFETAVTRAALRKMPNYRECMAQSCKSGQFHDTKTGGNIFRCNQCGFRVCTVHEVPFHDGETCRAYDKRTKIVSKQEEASRQAIARTSTPCPQCGINIEKAGGCDEMICNRCQHAFCYKCNAPYHGPNGVLAIGNSAHAESCPHYRTIPRNIGDPLTDLSWMGDPNNEAVEHRVAEIMDRFERQRLQSHNREMSRARQSRIREIELIRGSLHLSDAEFNEEMERLQHATMDRRPARSTLQIPSVPHLPSPYIRAVTGSQVQPPNTESTAARPPRASRYPYEPVISYERDAHLYDQSYEETSREYTSSPSNHTGTIRDGVAAAAPVTGRSGRFAGAERALPRGRSRVSRANSLAFGYTTGSSRREGSGSGETTEEWMRRIRDGQAGGGTGEE